MRFYFYNFPVELFRLIISVKLPTDDGKIKEGRLFIRIDFNGAAVKFLSFFLSI